MSAPQILGTGHCVPKRVVTNDELSETVETSDEWIYTRTGIHSRHFSAGENGLDLAEAAARQALESAGVSPEEIGVCLVGTCSPDRASPSTACRLQKVLGLQEDTICYDINAACAGFLYGLKTAHALLADCSRPYALVIGVEVLSRILDMQDRNTCILFGDGAGAAVIRRNEERHWHTVEGTRTSETAIWVQGPGQNPATIHMDGKPVFRFALEVVEKSIKQLLAAEGCTLDDVDLVVCHQANARIIERVQKKLRAREGQFFMNMETYGNTSAASIPIALDELVRSGALKPGMRVLCVGFGAGLTWAGMMLQW